MSFLVTFVSGFWTRDSPQGLPVSVVSVPNEGSRLCLFIVEISTFLFYTRVLGHHDLRYLCNSSPSRSLQTILFQILRRSSTPCITLVPDVNLLQILRYLLFLNYPRVPFVLTNCFSTVPLQVSNSSSATSFSGNATG